MVCEVEDRAVVKFGISDNDEPWLRAHGHIHSADNPLRTRRLPFHVATCFRFESMHGARQVENALKQGMLNFLPRAPIHVPPADRLMVLIAGGGRAESPSGEWLFYRLCGDRGTRPAVAVFYSFASEALHGAYARTRGDGLIRSAISRFNCADRLWSLGSGYTVHTVVPAAAARVKLSRCIAAPTVNA